MPTDKIGVIGDLHLKDNLGYADYITDRRIPEKEEILNFIVENLKDCDTIVFLGDQFNRRNNPSLVIKEFVSFVERFDGKQIYILAGNHEKQGDGKSAIDFLKAILGKAWEVIVDTVAIETIARIDEKTNKISPTLESKIVFCPYFSKAELGTKDNQEGSKLIMEKIGKGDILFVHHAISDTLTAAGIDTNIFPEPVLPKKELEKNFKLIFGGHIHTPQVSGTTIVAGSIFNEQIGDTGRYIWKIQTGPLKVEQIPLPGRKVYGLKDPEEKDLKPLEKNSIVKVTITKKETLAKLEQLKTKLRKFDAYLLLEQIPKERKKLHFGGDEGLLEFDIDQLLEMFAKERKIDLEKVKKGFELIR